MNSMLDDQKVPAPLRRSESPHVPAMADNSFSRFLGGPPLAVIVRLLLISLIVGALLMWLDIRPVEILRGVERLFQRLWDLGFDAIRVVLEYVVAGAVIVVPIWLVMRLLNAGRKG